MIYFSEVTIKNIFLTAISSMCENKRCVVPTLSNFKPRTLTNSIFVKRPTYVSSKIISNKNRSIETEISVLNVQLHY